MEPQGLSAVGFIVSTRFKDLSGLTPAIKDLEVHNARLVIEEQRFRIWAASMGLLQKGHASLEYRVRDASLLKDGIFKILDEMASHLDNLLAIARCDRGPLNEEGECFDEEEPGSDIDNTSDWSDAEFESLDEVGFRVNCLVECVDALYNLAIKIRNPRNRPQRTMQQLCERVPPNERLQFIEERQSFEVARLSHYHKERLMQDVGLIDCSTTASLTSSYLLRRAGIANARRREQFIYWRAHAVKLAYDSSWRSESGVLADDALLLSRHEPGTSQAGLTRRGPQAKSLATSATPLPLKEDNSGDVRSYISQSSRTPIAAEDDSLEWPAPPNHPPGTQFFVCPYCKILCPGKYLQGNSWIKHLIHDVQPYMCTHEDCEDGERIYGSRREWIEHEGLHSQYWRCQEHKLAFQSHSEYRIHISTTHEMSVIPEPALEVSSKQSRICPLCPRHITENFTSPELLQHFELHLLRFARLALFSHENHIEIDADSQTGINSVDNCGREDSLLADFPPRLRLKNNLLDFGEKHPSTLTSMANLASTYIDQEQWEEAEKLAVHAIETRKRVIGEEHPDTLSSIADLVLLYRNQEQWKKAENLAVQVKETRKRVLGEEHPDTLSSIADLALLYKSQMRWEEAEELEVQVMEMRKRVLGEEHPDTLSSIAGLVLLYRNQGQWEKAENLAVQVIETGKRVLGEEHPSTLTSMANLALIYMDQGQWEEAKKLEVQVMETEKRVFGKKHPGIPASI